tara:strand:+ start:1903 stop:4518 length:2616 start_codon:yes stop_codon:yes gene_type:complete
MKLFFKILIFLPSILFSQEFLEEPNSYWDNGKKQQVTFKNFDLEIVRINKYSPDGDLISSYNYNPKTGIRNGDFIDGDNRGFYNEGVLNSDNYTFTIDFESNGIGSYWNGKIVNGRPVGEVLVYQIRDLFEPIGLDDEWWEYRQTSVFKELLNFYRGKYISLGFTRYGLSKLFYNENGQLEGKQIINQSVNLYFDKDELTGLTIKNEQKPDIARDSVFKNNKIWKVDNKFVKNTGIYSLIEWSELRPFYIYFGVINRYVEDGPFYKRTYSNRTEKMGRFTGINSQMKPIRNENRNAYSSDFLYEGPYTNGNLKSISYAYPVINNDDSYKNRDLFNVLYNNPSPFLNDLGIFDNTYSNEIKNISRSFFDETRGPQLTYYKSSNDVHIAKANEYVYDWYMTSNYNLEESGYDLNIVNAFLLNNLDTYNTYRPLFNFKGIKDLMSSNHTISCSTIEWITGYIRMTDLSAEDKSMLIGYVNELDCSTEIPYIKSLSVLNKIINSKLLKVSDLLIFDTDKQRFVKLSEILIDYQVEFDKMEEIRIETENKRIEDEKVRNEKKAEAERTKNEISSLLASDFDYSIVENETFGTVLLIKFFPRKSKMQIFNEVFFDEFKEINPIGYSSNGGTMSVYINDNYTRDIGDDILKLKTDLDNEGKKKRILNKLKKNYSKFKRDKWFGFEEKFNPGNLILDELNLQELKFPNEVVISNWLRNELFRAASALYFPEDSYAFSGENLLPNEVAIYRDPDSQEISHYFAYNYPNLRLDRNVYSNNKNSPISTISDRYSSILLKTGEYWNSDNKEIYRTYYLKDYDDNPANDQKREVKLSLTSSDFESYFSSRINKHPVIRRAYQELFNIDANYQITTWPTIKTLED